jgi:hypothetical protein
VRNLIAGDIRRKLEARVAALERQPRELQQERC